MGWWALFRVAHLHIDVQETSLHHLESEPHLHPGADSIEEALVCVRIHVHEVAMHGRESQYEAQEQTHQPRHFLFEVKGFYVPIIRVYTWQKGNIALEKVRVVTAHTWPGKQYGYGRRATRHEENPRSVQE